MCSGCGSVLKRSAKAGPRLFLLYVVAFRLCYVRCSCAYREFVIRSEIYASEFKIMSPNLILGFGDKNTKVYFENRSYQFDSPPKKG